MNQGLKLLFGLLFLYTAAVQAGVISIFNALPPPNSKPISGESPLYQCDVSDKQLLEIKEIDLSPNPPVRGQNLTITANGEVFETIEEGSYVEVEVRLGYIRLLSQTFDLCQTLEDNDIEGLSCPIEPGSYDVKKLVEIPGEVPPGRYVVLARAYTESDDLITCVTGEVVFPPR
ncbi:sterol transporter [Saccharomyces eubayanus]|uniref:sterol transporter n=1 Tax=Saccharomyces eubayanus TaxID=1080349 RepID=UPI0006C65CB2|nr:NPC2-like protein [Saccharomyces eubayanus]KOH00314.1 NPC2-like protein [Saccharomyces eubayanus]